MSESPTIIAVNEELVRMATIFTDYLGKYNSHIGLLKEVITELNKSKWRSFDKEFPKDNEIVYAMATAKSIKLITFSKFLYPVPGDKFTHWMHVNDMEKGTEVQ
jgi:hypothetical protein